MARSLPVVQLVCAVCGAPVGRDCDVVEFPIPGSVNREAEGLCPGCLGWLFGVMDEAADAEWPDEPEPEVDDGPRWCPECERPNQFGQLCEACRDEIRQETGEERL